MSTLFLFIRINLGMLGLCLPLADTFGLGLALSFPLDNTIPGALEFDFVPLEFDCVPIDATVCFDLLLAATAGPGVCLDMSTLFISLRLNTGMLGFCLLGAGLLPLFCLGAGLLLRLTFLPDGTLDAAARFLLLFLSC